MRNDKINHSISEIQVRRSETLKPDIIEEIKKTNKELRKTDFENLPGPKVNNWDEILFNVKELLYVNDPFLLKRKEWRNNLYELNDGKNCERIVNHFKHNEKYQ